MCYSVSVMADRAELESVLDARFEHFKDWEPKPFANAFDRPYLPVLNGKPRVISGMYWGLVPGWVKTAKEASEISRKTANARAEFIHVRPAFRDSAVSRRCILPVTGFFEWRHHEGRKYPYLIYPREGKVFPIAGLFSEWQNEATGLVERTFTILTTRANPLLEVIHNSKKRMPVILDEAGVDRWLDPSQATTRLSPLFEPFDEGRMKAHPVRRAIWATEIYTATPSDLDPVEYSELNVHQKRLF